MSPLCIVRALRGEEISGIDPTVEVENGGEEPLKDRETVVELMSRYGRNGARSSPGSEG